MRHVLNLVRREECPSDNLRRLRRHRSNYPAIKGNALFSVVPRLRSRSIPLINSRLPERRKATRPMTIVLDCWHGRYVHPSGIAVGDTGSSLSKAAPGNVVKGDRKLARDRS